MTEAEASNTLEVAENFGVEMRFLFVCFFLRTGVISASFTFSGARVRAGGTGSSREGMGPKEQVDKEETGMCGQLGRGHWGHPDRPHTLVLKDHLESLLCYLGLWD